MVNMAGMNEKKILEAREHLREAEKWYKPTLYVVMYAVVNDNGCSSESDAYLRNTPIR